MVISGGILTLLLLSLFLSLTGALKTGSSCPLLLNFIAACSCSRTLPTSWPGCDWECLRSWFYPSPSLSTLASKVTLDPLGFSVRAAFVASPSCETDSSRVFFDALSRLLIKFDGLRLLFADTLVECTPFVERVDLDTISRPPGMGLNMPLNSCLI